MKIEPKNTTIDEEESNAGSPSLSNGNGDGGTMVVNSRMQAINEVDQSETFNSISSESTLMEAGAKDELERLFDQLKCGRIREYDLMYNSLLFKMAYYRIKSIPVNMTPGVDRETLDGISVN